jgi:hypothetical protein
MAFGWLLDQAGVFKFQGHFHGGKEGRYGVGCVSDEKDGEGSFDFLGWGCSFVIPWHGISFGLYGPCVTLEEDG